MARTRAPSQELQSDRLPVEQAPVGLAGVGQPMAAQGQLGNAAVAAQTGVNGPQRPGERTDISQYTPAYVEAHRDELGIPAGAPVEDFFNEFVAHKLAYQDLSSWASVKPGDPQYASIQAQKQMLESWGYRSDIGADQEVRDPKTGLYAVRLDPSEQGLAQGRGSVAAFRGTEPLTPGQTSLSNPWGAFNDVLTDFSTSVGANQYNANADRIRALMAGGKGDLTTTGHSLGGYLAQKAASANADLMGKGDVVTFQSGGLNREDAWRFEGQNQDGHIGVRHHYTDMDVVHRAGEKRLPGTFFEHQAAGLTEGHTKYMMYNDRDVTTLSEATGGKRVVQSDRDSVSNWSRHYWEGARTGAGGFVRLGMAPNNAAWQLGTGLGRAGGNAAWGLGNSAYQAYDGVSGGLGTALGGTANGLGQMMHGDLLGGMGTMGGGMLSGTGQALNGGGRALWGLGGTGVGAARDTAGALWDGASTLVGDTAQGLYQMGRGGVNLVEGEVGRQVAKAKELGTAAWEGTKWAGNKAAQAGEAAWEGTKWAGGKAVDAGKWAGGKALEAGEAAWEGTKWAGNKVADAGSAAWEGTKWAGGKAADAGKAAWDFATSW